MMSSERRGFWPPPGEDGNRRTTTREEVLRSFESYQAAEQAQRVLADRGFPSAKVRIVARDLAFVERTGTSRAVQGIVVDGAWSGAVVGALTGCLFGWFTWFAAMQSVLVLAFWGALFGGVVGALVAAIAPHRSTDRHESIGSLQAGCYDVVVDQDVTSEARRLFLAAEPPLRLTRGGAS